MKARSKIIIVLAIVVIIIIAAVAVLITGQSEVKPAPDFKLVDIEGNNITLSNITDKIIILDFMFIDCPSCLVAEKNLKNIYPKFEDDIHIISIDVVLTDTVEALEDHREEAGIDFKNWTIAKDAVQQEGGYVYQLYNVNEFVTIYVVDKNGYATYHKIGAVSSEELEEAINKAILGTSPILVQQMSMVVLAIMAGIASFFSPCAFPMLPGYMAYFLGLQVSQKEEHGSKGLYRKAVFGGIAGGIGIISVYIIIGVIIITFGTMVTPYIPLLGPIVGVILIILGFLMLTDIQYTRLVRPFQILASKFSRKKKEEKKEEPEKPEGGKKTKGYYIKLFRYGVGYGAAASACVAPLFIVLVLTASAASITGTILDGLIVLLLYALVVIGLMVGITLALTFFGQKATQKLSKYTEVIKKISALVLIIVGIALIAFYVIAFI